MVGSISLPLLGLILYLSIAFTLIGSGARARIVELALSFSGALVSIYLIALQLFTIKALCFWCLLSDITMITLALVSFLRLKRED